MILSVSRVTIFLERSTLFRWFEVIANMFIFYSGYRFLVNDTNLGPGIKFIITSLAMALALGFLAHITQWASYIFRDRVEIASFNKGKLCLSLDFHEEFETKKINAIEFFGPPSFIIACWPYTKYTIRLVYDDKIKELKTRFRLKSIANFFDDVNQELIKDNKS
ncbi:hypothetical protein [Nitrincola sp. MINF-07-Sa-05]|uniref:hypothetical protein n=1 Tax=Nitrincola salilacus TaxID=3400273 RepID=UPI003917D92A